jgi:hypothetical protein
MTEKMFGAEKSVVVRGANSLGNDLSLLSLKDVENVLTKHFKTIDRNGDTKLVDLEIENFWKSQPKNSLELRVASFVRDHQADICRIIPFYHGDNWKLENSTPRTGFGQDQIDLLADMGRQGYGHKVIEANLSTALCVGSTTFLATGACAVKIWEWADRVRLFRYKTPILLAGVAAATIGASYLSVRYSQPLASEYYAGKQATVNELAKRLAKY